MRGCEGTMVEDYHVDLQLDPQAEPEVLDGLLTQLVEAAGGQAGVMTTRHASGPITSLYGLDLEESRPLVGLMESLVEQGGIPPEQLAELEQEARRRGGGRPLAIPIRSRGKPVGVFCLWHRSEAPPLLHDSPGLVHLNVDQFESSMQGARLLERLLHERKWLEAVVQHSTDGVIIHDPQGRVMGYNLMIARLSGWKIGEAVGQPGHEAFPLVLADSHVFDSPSALAVSGNVPWLSSTDPVEARLLGKDGQSVEVEVVGAPLFDRQGQPLGWVMTVRDISKRKEMERLHKLFLSAVSHELQTPIAIIRGYAGLMADPEVELKNVREHATVIEEEAHRLEHMVQQMLYATRIQAGGLKLQRQVVELGPWLKKLCDKLRPVYKSRGVKLSLHEERKGLFAAIDEERLQQVVTNFVENAFKYAGARPVQVNLRQDGSRWARVEVQDSGPGIPAEDRDRIFTAFERGGDPLKQRVRGAGLGLYICKAIIEAHGGKVGVDAHKDGGAVFFFTLPKEK
ncbi:MAG: ATP-binding protein [Vulcanimicrobiota bacterium]